MTACKDVQDMNLGKKAVSAALAGTLAVGMVPGVALAATADDAAADDGIETLALDAEADLSGGKITGATLGGVAVADPAKATVAITDFVNTASTGTAAYELKDFAITQITTKSGVVIPLSKGNYTIEYWNNAETDPTYVTSLEEAPESGDQKIQVTLAGLTGALSVYNDQTIDATLNVVGASLAGTVAYVQGDEGNTNFVYNFDGQKFDFYLQGKKLSPADDYTVLFYNSNGESLGADKTPENIGSYSAVLTGKGTYDGSKVTVPVQVKALDLAKADIVLSGSKGNPIELVSVNKVDKDDTNDALLMKVTGPDGEVNNGAVGPYKVVISAADPNNKNITGSQTLSYDIANADAVFNYNGQELPAATGGQWTVANGAYTYTYNAGTAGNVAFDYSKLTAVGGDENLAVDYKVTDGENNPATLADLSKPGTWKVTATVNTAAAENAFGGTQTITVVNWAGSVLGNTDIVVKQDGAVNGTPSFPYTGKNVLDNLTITVNSGKTVLTEGKDYEVEITKGGQKVTEAINQGVYTLTFDSKSYDFDSNNTVTVTVTSAAVTGVRAVETIEYNNEPVLAYTGEVIKPTFEYTTDALDTPADKAKAVWQTLPADQYTVAYTQATGAVDLKNPGVYDVAFTCVPVEQSKNFDFDAITDAQLTVAKVESAFMDVPASAWYYEVIAEASAAAGDNSGDYANAPYMSGYAGTKLFGPNDRITRGQVACVLFNMAGGKAGGVTDDKFDVNEGYETGFSDVDGHAYYAQAIAWAKTTGVVNGYAGTDKFGPNDFVTREQFAAMLANYAKASGKDITVEDAAAVLAAMPDGSKVSDWAKDSVAWAVANKYMGNGGTIAPQSSITRAEVAAMAVNYQPRTKIA